MVVDCGTAYLFYQSGEIGGGYIQFVGIEANLSFLAEVAIQMVEEDLIYFLLVPKVVGDAALLVRQFVDDEFEHVEHTLDHFHLINILVSHDVAHEVEDIGHALLFVIFEVEEGGVAGKLFIHEDALRLEIWAHLADGCRLLGCHDEEVARLEG